MKNEQIIFNAVVAASIMTGAEAMAILQICDSHFPNDCANCPLRAACEAGKNAGETDAEFTARWESGMVAALKSTMEV